MLEQTEGQKMMDEATDLKDDCNEERNRMSSQSVFPAEWGCDLCPTIRMTNVLRFVHRLSPLMLLRSTVMYCLSTDIVPISLGMVPKVCKGE